MIACAICNEHSCIRHYARFEIDLDHDNREHATWERNGSKTRVALLITRMEGCPLSTPLDALMKGYEEYQRAKADRQAPLFPSDYSEPRS